MSLLDTTWTTWLAATREADELKVGDWVRVTIGYGLGEISQIEAIDRTSTFGHFVRINGVLVGKYRFDLQRITEEEVQGEPQAL